MKESKNECEKKKKKELNKAKQKEKTKQNKNKNSSGKIESKNVEIDEKKVRKQARKKIGIKF